jgi:glycosyltransferase involved in cell wall biosynthesis
MTTWVVIPAYNEAATLAEVARAALAHAGGVVVVDDGSTDATAAAVAHLPVHLVAHELNEGKSASLLDGMLRARALGATSVVTMDGDGQHRACDIPRLVRAAESYPRAIVIGARTRMRDRAPPLRRFANRFADFLISWAAGQRVLDSQSGQRLYPAALFESLDVTTLSRDGFTLESEILIAAADLGFAVISVPIDTIYGAQARASHFRPWRHVSSIAGMLIVRIVGRALRLANLWASLRARAVVIDDRSGAAPDAEAAPHADIVLPDLERAAFDADR